MLIDNVSAEIQATIAMGIFGKEIIKKYEKLSLAALTSVTASSSLGNR